MAISTCLAKPKIQVLGTSDPSSTYLNVQKKHGGTLAAAALKAGCAEANFLWGGTTKEEKIIF